MPSTIERSVSDSRYQSTLDAVYVYVVPWSEFTIVPSYPHYTQPARVFSLEARFQSSVGTNLYIRYLVFK